MNAIGESNALIVNVIDIFDFNGSVIPGLHRFVGDNPVILVGNKTDVLPKSLNPNRLKNWLQQQAKAQGLRPVATMLASAKKVLALMSCWMPLKNIVIIETFMW